MNQRITKKLARETNKPLNGREVLDLVNGRANVITYPELKKFTSIEGLLQPYGACYILYMKNKSSGHWCCLTQVGTLISFFDPYGGPIDSQLKFTWHKIPYLTKLLSQAAFDGYKVTFNPYQFQKLRDNVKSCGRWCALRIVLKDMPLKDFKKLFMGANSDEVATIVTEMLL